MPLYEYECTVCGHRFEVIQRFSDAPIERCQKCESPVVKLLSAPAIQFKGTGWYVTDYAHKNTSEAASKSGPSAPGSESSSQSESAKDAKSDSDKRSASSQSDSSKSSSSSDSGGSKSESKPASKND